MGRKKAKVLISLISALMVCLLASTATTTVAAGDWGNLEAGDEMEWKAVPPDDPDVILYWELEIVGISGADMTYNYQATAVSDSSTYSWSGTETDQDIVWFILSQSFLQKAKAAPDSKETNFNWEGTNYKAYYLKQTLDGGDTDEHWVDQGTGIIFETQRTTGGTTHTRLELMSTTADLTEAGGICLGTLFIALVSVSTVVSYSLVRYRKRKNLA